MRNWLEDIGGVSIVLLVYTIGWGLWPESPVVMGLAIALAFYAGKAVHALQKRGEK